MKLKGIVIINGVNLETLSEYSSLKTSLLSSCYKQEDVSTFSFTQVAIASKYTFTLAIASKYTLTLSSYSFKVYFYSE